MQGKAATKEDRKILKLYEENPHLSHFEFTELVNRVTNQQKSEAYYSQKLSDIGFGMECRPPTQKEVEKLIVAYRLEGPYWHRIADIFPEVTPKRAKQLFERSFASVVHKINNIAVECEVDCVHPMLEPPLIEQILIIAFDRFNRRLAVPEDLRVHCSQIITRITDCWMIDNIPKEQTGSVGALSDKDPSRPKTNSLSAVEWHRNRLTTLNKMICDFKQQQPSLTQLLKKPEILKKRQKLQESCLDLPRFRGRVCKEVITMKNQLMQLQEKYPKIGGELIPVLMMLNELLWIDLEKEFQENQADCNKSSRQAIPQKPRTAMNSHGSRQFLLLKD